MNIFLDANILVSILNKEYPLFSYTSRIISLADYKKAHLVITTPICLAIAFYFSEKKSGTRLAKEKIALLATKLSVAVVDVNTVVQALQNKKIHDFEDGMQYYAAKEAGCTVIVTENTGDFYYSEIEVLNALDFLEKYMI
jgi:predicted nucleic acid-binding protein